MNAGLCFRELSALILLLNLSAFSFVIANGYLFDSIAHLKSLVDLENDLGARLKAYVASQRNDFEKVKDFSELVGNVTNLAKHQGRGYINNPINAYFIIKRFTDGWSKMADRLIKDDDVYNGKIDTSFFL
jgi:prolyl 4-hydroxylase